ncbi:hypothetical protein C1H46_013611 [Malus baccata]|uniref:Uncharacterized protein n=1 Tax=Malus baccata TaxID=106549 RepID=A0A540MPU3_MALBA|nr:hypothetical protein C1H46_013611 [Malus baccata]
MICDMHYKMSNLISNQRAASRGSETPTQGCNVVATSTPDLDTTGVPPVMPLRPTVSTAAASSTSSMMHHVPSAR